MKERVLTLKEVSILLGYAFLVQGFSTITPKQIGHVLALILQKQAKIVEMTRYEITCIDNRSLVPSTKTEKAVGYDPAPLIRCLGEYAVFVVLVGVVSTNIMGSLSSNYDKITRKITLKMYTNRESDRYAKVASRYPEVAHFLSKAVLFYMAWAKKKKVTP